jgi:hypothetical protein
LRIFDSGFENGVAELLAGDSKFDSAVAEFDISDSADHAVAAGRHGGREVLCSSHLIGVCADMTRHMR